MSILPICSMACMTRPDFCGSLSVSISPSILGMICHETPNLSFNQPHRLSAPPADSRSHSSSTSACVSHETNSEIASVNLNIGPPLNAMNRWPSSSKGAGKDRALRTWPPGLAAAGNADDPGVLENRDVVVHGLLSLAFEPQKRCDLLH